MSVRKMTAYLLEMAEDKEHEGFWETLARECLARMSEDEVRCMAFDCDWDHQSDEEGDYTDE